MIMVARTGIVAGHDIEGGDICHQIGLYAAVVSPLTLWPVAAIDVPENQHAAGILYGRFTPEEILHGGV